MIDYILAILIDCIMAIMTILGFIAIVVAIGDYDHGNERMTAILWHPHGHLVPDIC